MADTDLKLSSTNGEKQFTICTFCNNSTNGYEKRLFAAEQPKGPFFPVLAELQGDKTKLDLLGRAVVCVACFHHLLRQWSSFERRGIPIRKREYNIITDDRVSSYQVRREEEIRKEAEQKIKEVQDREERIRQEAELRFEKYRQRRAEIRREAEERLLEEQTRAEALKKETSTKLKEEQLREEQLRQEAEERIREEKEKRDYIRQEAERLLREEKLLESEKFKQSSQPSSPEVTKQEPQPLNPDIVTSYRTEVIIPFVETVNKNSPSKETAEQRESDNMDGSISEIELSARSKSRKMMVFDPETGCYRKKSENEDQENTFTESKKERVEYRFSLRSDEKPEKATEAKDSSSKPDEASEDIQVITTEQSITINGKNKSRSDEGDEEDLKKAGEIMKAKFEKGRKKFEEEPFERKRNEPTTVRTARQTSDDSLEEKIKEMEKRRERLFLKRPSMELEKRRSSDEQKDLSPRGEAESPRAESKSSADDTAKRSRSRSERTKRRLTAEEMSLKKTTSEEDLAERRRSNSGSAKVPKTEERITETKKETFRIELDRSNSKPEDEVFVTHATPAEAGSIDLMSWEDDSTDGTTPVKDKVQNTAFRKRAESMEGETFPKAENLVEIEAPISVTPKTKVESTPDTTGAILDLDEDSNMSTPVLESISTWDNRARASNTADEDRRRRELEHEERKRRIEERQRAAKELKAKRKSGGDFDESTRTEEPAREMTMKEKRRSLLDMWESFSEPQSTVISFEETEGKPSQQRKKVLVRENRTISFDPAEENNDGIDMELDDEEKFTSSTPIPATRKKKLSEEEQKWENAENFQPGRLQKTVFHSLSESEPAMEEPKAKPRKGPSRYNWMKGESYEDQEALVPTKLKIDWQNNQATDESGDKVTGSQPKPAPRQMETKTVGRDSQSSSDDSESESEDESNSEEERKPRIDLDENHKLTEEEKQWESAGHFQPKKLNTALMASFLQGDSGDVVPMPKKPQDPPKKLPQTSPEQRVESPIKAPKDEVETEKISPVNEEKTETEPYTPGTYTYEESSDSDDDIPGWRKVEERRRQQEREEIERARLEERRRMEREAMEEENKEGWSDSSDDEFEAKVRTKEIRRINPSLLGQFLNKPEKEPEKPVKSRKPLGQKVELSNVQLIESPPSIDLPLEEEGHERTEEDEYEEKVKSRQVRKLKLDNSPFLQAKEEDHARKNVPHGSRVVLQEESYVQKIDHTIVESVPSIDVGTNEPEINTYVTSTKESSESSSSDEDDSIPGWRKVEEQRRKQEREEIERSKLEEQRRREREASGSEEEDSDSVDDEFEAKVRTKEIRKINPNLLTHFMGESVDRDTPPSSGRLQKETIQIERVQSKESSSSDDSDVEERKEKEIDGENDEFELKVKSGQVKRLVLDNSPFTQSAVKEEPPLLRRRTDEKSQKETKEVQRMLSIESSSSEESDVEDVKKKDSDDEFEQKVKAGQVRKLVLDNSPFMQTSFKEEPQKRPTAAKKTSSPKAAIQEETLVQVTEDKVVESEPDLVYHEPREDDDYEEKVKSRLVKRLSQDQFGFLRKQEEEQQKRAQEEERRRAEREERERVKKEEERRRRLEAEAQAKEEERIRREEETRRREEKETARKEEERTRRKEEAERIRREEEERLRKEEEEEQMRLEEMRRQKQAAKKKFESGVFDEISINHTENDIYSVGRLDTNKLMQFQQGPQEEPKIKSKKRDKERKVTEEYKTPESQVETVNIATVDLIESSPYTDGFDKFQSEDLEYEEKRKSVGKLDRDWYIKQQLKQAEEHDQRARQLEEQRLREERSEMVRLREETGSKKLEEAEPIEETRGGSDSGKRRSKLAADKFSLYEHESRPEPTKSSKEKRKKDDSVKKGARDDVQAINDKRKSKSSEEGSVIILTKEEEAKALRLQREREETELLREEEERRRLTSQEETYEDERESDKPKTVGKLNQEQFSMFQHERVKDKAKPRKQPSQMVEEIISVQSQKEVESAAPVSFDQADFGPAETPEDAEYEQRINTGRKLDVSKFLGWRAQEDDEKRQRSKLLAEERMLQEQGEMAKLRAEEKKRMLEESDEGYVEETTGDRVKPPATKESDYGKSRKISIERRKSQPDEPDEERHGKGTSVGRLPKELCSAFEGDTPKTENSDSRRRSSKSKGSRQQSGGDSLLRSSRNSSDDSLSYVAQDSNLNGSVSPREKEYLNEKAMERRDSSSETQDHDKPIESYTPEEKAVPKKLHTSMLAAFQKSQTEPEVQLRQGKGEKRLRPKSIGNVDLLRWEEDSNVRQSSSSGSKKEKTGRQPRPKSIAY